MQWAGIYAALNLKTEKKKNRLFNIMCHEITIQPLEKPLNTYALTGPSDP